MFNDLCVPIQFGHQGTLKLKIKGAPSPFTWKTWPYSSVDIFVWPLEEYYIYIFHAQPNSVLVFWA